VKAAVPFCRPDKLFGLWAIEEVRFRRMVELARSADLAQLRAESRAAAATASSPRYELLPDGIAVIDIAGPMTKYPTTFQALLGGTSTLRAREALRAASRSDVVSGIMLRIDSPGGTTAGLGELAEGFGRPRPASRSTPTLTTSRPRPGAWPSARARGRRPRRMPRSGAWASKWSLRTRRRPTPRRASRCTSSRPRRR